MEQPQPITNKQLNGDTAQPSIWIRTVCRKGGRELTDDQVRLLEKYVSLLLEWNRKINLISRKDEGNIWSSHILHSLSPLFKIDLPDGARVLDLGSGGGLPGIPWRILLPTISVVMLDATQKKVNAVLSMVKDLELSNTEAVWGRAEELGPSAQLRGRFEYVVARGVGPLDELARLARPFLRHRVVTEKKNEGSPGPPALLAFKGGEIEQEVHRTKLLKGIGEVEIIPLSFNGSGGVDPTDKKLVIVHFDNLKD